MEASLVLLLSCGQQQHKEKLGIHFLVGCAFGWALWFLWMCGLIVAIISLCDCVLLFFFSPFFSLLRFVCFTLPFSFLGLDFQSYLSGLDFLPQLTTAFPVKRNPVGSSAQGIRSSPLHALVGSPIKEEEEHPETDTKKTNLGKQETKEALKQVYCAHCCYECSF